MTNGLPKLLVVDDDAALGMQLRWAFSDYEVSLAGERESAMTIVRKVRPPVVLLDLGLPPDPHGPTEGMAALDQVLLAAPETKVIMMSGQTEREYAVRAVSRGAYDFYEKPIDVDALTLIVQRASRLFALEAENRRLSNTVGAAPFPGLITANNVMRGLCADARRLAAANVAVLLLGDSGTGKEVFANGIHALSQRANGPFVAINCAAIPENLLESELFGHEKGAFTGAISQTLGKVELASRGTLFLDEIGDLPLALQAKLLRFLEQRVIERVGGRKLIAVDIRLITATNRDLPRLIADGKFREDLFYRVAQSIIEIPPLRARPEDVVLLAQHFLHTKASSAGRTLRGFTAEALAALAAHPWPGNVRELENRIERSLAVAVGQQVTLADLDLPSADPLPLATLRKSREQADRTAITRAMIAANGNISKASKILDISRPTLYQLLREYNLMNE